MMEPPPTSHAEAFFIETYTSSKKAVTNIQ
jgi:hypothetical protein